MTLALGALGLLLLLAGGEALVRGAAALALRLGLSPLSVGLTVVAFGTSMPELVVSLDAALAGVPDIAVGNVVGSNIANLTLILGFAALVRPFQVGAVAVRREAPFVVGLSLLLVAMLHNGTVSRPEGAALVLGLVLFTAFALYQGRQEAAEVVEEFEGALAPAPNGIPRSVLLIVGGLAALVAGGHLFLDAAVFLARAVGVSEAVVGLTVVAVGTSLPELAATALAALRKEGDVAVGNVLGSNIFNILSILGITALVLPLRVGGISGGTLGVMVLSAVVVPVFAASGRELSRVEGAALLGGYVGYVGWLVAGSG